MSGIILSIDALILKADQLQPDNTTKLISPSGTRQLDQDLAVSNFNKITDADKVGLQTYKTTRPYLVGEATIFGGVLYECITNTQGGFNAAHWTAVDLGNYGGLQLGAQVNGLVLTGTGTQTLELQLASGSTNGALSSTDWNTFNNKADSLGFTPENEANKGIPNGYVPLNATGKIDVGYIPDGIIGSVTYQGTWNAATNTPALSDATGSQGQYYVVNTFGTQNLGSGSLIFDVGDWVIHNGTTWDKLDNSNVDQPSGIVETIIAGSGIVVDSSDPANPIVSRSGSTSAGLTTRNYFRGDTITKAAGTFYTVEPDKGTVASVVQTVVCGDDTTTFFGQDALTTPYPVDVVIPAGTYNSQLIVEVDSNAGQQEVGFEIYLTDSDGNVVDSGILSLPVGNLGVRPLVYASSGVIDVLQNQATPIDVEGQLVEDFTFATTNNIRFHAFARKVGTDGGNVTFSLYYGSDYNSFLDVPTSTFASSVVNDSGVSGGFVSDALDWLQANSLQYQNYNVTTFEVNTGTDGNGALINMGANDVLIQGDFENYVLASNISGVEIVSNAGDLDIDSGPLRKINITSGNELNLDSSVGSYLMYSGGIYGVYLDNFGVYIEDGNDGSNISLYQGFTAETYSFGMTFNSYGGNYVVDSGSNNSTVGSSTSGNAILTTQTGDVILQNVNSNLTLDHVNGLTLTDGTSSGGYKEAADYSANYTDLSLTNKGFNVKTFQAQNPRVQSVTNTTSLTPNAELKDEFYITAQAEALTINNPNGTFSVGRQILISIEDNGTAQSLSFGSEFRGIGFALPTTTTAGKIMYLLAKRSANGLNWDVIAMNEEL